MMCVKEKRVSASKAPIIVAFICIIASIVLLILGYKGSASISAHPLAMAILGFIALSSQIRYVCIAENALCICYTCGVKRFVPLARVRRIEFVTQRSEHYMLISLDNCQPFGQSNCDVRNYVFLHPISVVGVPISSGEVQKCIETTSRWNLPVFKVNV